MRCSGCGKDIPFAGEVCPYCQRDKTDDQKFQVVVGFFLIAGGAIGYWIGDVKGLMWGAGSGLVAGLVAAASWGLGGVPKSNPPVVKIAPGEASPSAPEIDIRKRLADLEALHKDGLVTETEFAAKRARLLEEL